MRRLPSCSFCHYGDAPHLGAPRSTYANATGEEHQHYINRARRRRRRERMECQESQRRRKWADGRQGGEGVRRAASLSLSLSFPHSTGGWGLWESERRHLQGEKVKGRPGKRESLSSLHTIPLALYPFFFSLRLPSCSHKPTPAYHCELCKKINEKKINNQYKCIENIYGLWIGYRFILFPVSV